MVRGQALHHFRLLTKAEDGHLVVGLEQRQRVQSPGTQFMERRPMLELLSTTRATAKGSSSWEKERFAAPFRPRKRGNPLASNCHGAPMVIVNAHFHQHQVNVHFKSCGTRRRRCRIRARFGWSGGLRTQQGTTGQRQCYPTSNHPDQPHGPPAPSGDATHPIGVVH